MKVKVGNQVFIINHTGIARIAVLKEINLDSYLQPFIRIKYKECPGILPQVTIFLDLSAFPHDRESGYMVWQEYHQSEVVFLSLCLSLYIYREIFILYRYPYRQISIWIYICLSLPLYTHRLRINTYFFFCPLWASCGEHTQHSDTVFV